MQNPLEIQVKESGWFGGTPIIGNLHICSYCHDNFQGIYMYLPFSNTAMVPTDPQPTLASSTMYMSLQTWKVYAKSGTSVRSVRRKSSVARRCQLTQIKRCFDPWQHGKSMELISGKTGKPRFCSADFSDVHWNDFIRLSLLDDSQILPHQCLPFSPLFPKICQVINPKITMSDDQSPLED
jgi:hypothetical protein